MIPTHALNGSTYTTSIIFLVLSATVSYFFSIHWRLWVATIIGLVVGVLIGIVSDRFTNDKYTPVKDVAKMSQAGPAFTLLGGMSYGVPALIGLGLQYSFILCNRTLR